MKQITENRQSKITVLESTDDQVRIRLDIATVDIVNENGRFYSRAVYEAANKSAKEQLEAGTLWGLLDHPTYSDSAKGKIENIVIKYDKLGIDGNTVYGEGVLINTQKGRDLHELSKAGVTLGVSTNGYGSSLYKPAKELLANSARPDELIAEMQLDYRYNTIDIVSQPSNSGGKIQSVESEIMTLEELKIKDPEGYAKLMAEVKVSQALTVGNSEALEKQLEALTAKLAAKDATEAQGAREALAMSMLADAKLAQLPVAEGAFDANKSFEARVKRVAVEAKSLEAAKESIELEISERKAVLPVDATNNHVVIKESNAPKSASEFDSYRSASGLL